MIKLEPFILWNRGVDLGGMGSTGAERASAYYLLIEAEDDVGVAAVGEGVADGQVHPSHHLHLEQPQQALHYRLPRSLLSPTSATPAPPSKRQERRGRLTTTGAAATAEIKLNPAERERERARERDLLLGEERPPASVVSRIPEAERQGRRGRRARACAAHAYYMRRVLQELPLLPGPPVSSAKSSTYGSIRSNEQQHLELRHLQLTDPSEGNYPLGN